MCDMNGMHPNHMRQRRRGWVLDLSMWRVPGAVEGHRPLAFKTGARSGELKFPMVNGSTMVRASMESHAL